MIKERKMKFYSKRDLDKLPQLQKLTSDERFAIKVASNILPFRSNNYIIEELINWDNVPNDPIFQLNFMQKGMLITEQFNRIADLLNKNASHKEIKTAANEIRYKLNPHPEEQLTANVPLLNENIVRGVQHKYKETCLVFPSPGQTCHAYCTFCFRWAQFIGLNDIKFATDESKRFQKYLKHHKELTDVLFTGGDPMVMSASKLKLYLEPLLSPEFNHIKNIRIGTKSISYWPYRYISDEDSGSILRLFEKLVNAGKHLAIMAHVNHWVEIYTDTARAAIRNIRNTGAEIRTQSPIIKHINDKVSIWAKMWEEEVKLGMIPYYMFIARDTGAQQYFSVPLAKAFQIFREAYIQVSGLARTVRGPIMSATPGKVEIQGITKINEEKVFVLSFLQGRNSDWVKRPFFAKFDENATWLDNLTPAFGKKKFFFKDELEQILREKLDQQLSQQQQFEETLSA